MTYHKQFVFHTRGISECKLIHLFKKIRIVWHFLSLNLTIFFWSILRVLCCLRSIRKLDIQQQSTDTVGCKCRSCNKIIEKPSRCKWSFIGAYKGRHAYTKEDTPLKFQNASYKFLKVLARVLFLFIEVFILVMLLQYFRTLMNCLCLKNYYPHQ